MPTAPPRELREHIARAGGYLSRNDAERAIASICAALRLFDVLDLSGCARAECDILISEFLRDLVSHPEMALLMDPGNTGTPRAIPHKPGQEGKLCVVLEGLAKLIREKIPERLRQEAGERLARKKNLIESGLQFLHEGRPAKGNAFFRRVAEEFGDDKGMYLHLARLSREAGQTRFAAEMFERAMEVQPQEPTAYAGAASAWVELHEHEKAEAVYKAALRTFGGHPATLGKMAKFYFARHRKPEAEEYALRALQTDSGQADALEVLAMLDKK
jgi:Tfp pilus assembly protein PilF